MKKSLFIILLSLISSTLIFSQTSSLKIKLEDAKTHEALIGATVRLKAKVKIGAAADLNGVAELKNIPSGKQAFAASFVGYENKEFEIELPLSDAQQPFLVEMLPSQEVIEEVVVTASRTNSRIEDLPIKVEVLGQEETTVPLPMF